MEMQGLEKLQEVVNLDMSRYTAEQADELLYDGAVAIVAGHYAVIMADIDRIDIGLDDDGRIAAVARSIDGKKMYLDLRR